MFRVGVLGFRNGSPGVLGVGTAKGLQRQTEASQCLGHFLRSVCGDCVSTKLLDTPSSFGMASEIERRKRLSVFCLL